MVLWISSCRSLAQSAMVHILTPHGLYIAHVMRQARLYLWTTVEEICSLGTKPFRHQGDYMLKDSSCQD